MYMIAMPLFQIDEPSQNTESTTQRCDYSSVSVPLHRAAPGGCNYNDSQQMIIIVHKKYIGIYYIKLIGYPSNID